MLEAVLPVVEVQTLRRMLPGLTSGDGSLEANPGGHRPLPGARPRRRRTTIDPRDREAYVGHTRPSSNPRTSSTSASGVKTPSAVHETGSGRRSARRLAGPIGLIVPVVRLILVKARTGQAGMASAVRPTATRSRAPGGTGGI